MATGTSKKSGGSSFLSELNPFNPNSPIYLLPGPSLTKQQEKQGPTLTPGPSNLIYTPGQEKTGSNLVQQATSAIGLGILGSGQFWEAVGLFIGGAILVVLAVKEFGGPDVIQTTTTAARRVAR